MRVVAAHGEEALALLTDGRWDGLVQAQPRPNPTQLSTWHRAAAEHGNLIPFVVAAERDGALAAGGAFGVRRELGGRLRVGAWLGGTYTAVSNDVLVAADGDDEATDAVVRRLLDEVAFFNARALQNGRLVASVTRVAPWASVTPDVTETWVVPVPPETLTKLLRAKAKDERRAARTGVEIVDVIATEPADVAPAIERLFRLYRERWADRPEEGASFATEKWHRAFHRAAIGAMAEVGCAQITEIWEDGVQVASHLALRVGRGGFAHTMAMRRARGLTSPGHRAYLLALEALREQGVEIADVGGGLSDPASPKGRLHPWRDPIAQVVVAKTPRLQRLARATFVARDGRRALRRRLAR